MRRSKLAYQRHNVIRRQLDYLSYIGVIKGSIQVNSPDGRKRWSFTLREGGDGSYQTAEVELILKGAFAALATARREG